jgi:glycosyltransferase involved in cell wall biosynthesis
MVEKVKTPINITEQRWPDNTEPLVSICCATYNHGQYIRDAMGGFLMQKTAFPVEILIHDDASTDNTADIVREYEEKYPQLIKTIYQTTNQWSKGNKPGRINRLRARGKYLAYCEGDDYWIDPCKLQKQVEFLETHPEYGLVHTDFNVFDDASGKIKSFGNPEKVVPQGEIFEKLLCANFIGTHTIMAKRNLLIEADSENDSSNKNWMMGDYPLWLEISKHHKIGYIEQVTSVYRLLSNSASHFSDASLQLCFFNSAHDVVQYFVKKYGCSPETKVKIDLNYYRLSLRHGITMNKYKLAKDARHHLTKLNKHLSWRDRCLIIFCSNNNFFSIGRFLYTKKL